MDPSRIQERAELLAKLQGAKRKRKRDDDDDEDDMDVDGEVKGSENDEAWEDSDKMDVDDTEGPSGKRVKTNTGAVVAKRMPRSNRSLAGLRDDVVSQCLFHTSTSLSS